jgi:hypothetical protein
VVGQEEPSPRSKPSAERLAADNRRLQERARQSEARCRELERLTREHRHAADRSQAEIRALKQELSESRRRLARTEKTAGRLDRAKEKAGQDKSSALQELKQARKEIDRLSQPDPKLQAPKTAPARRSPDWVPVISTMLKNGSFEAAQVFCETVRESEPESLYVHLALEHVYAKTGVHAKQLEECLWIAGRLLQRGQAARACAFACRALEVKPSHAEARSQLKQALEKISLSDESAVPAVRGLINRLKSANPGAYRAASEIIKDMGRQYWRAFEEQPGVLHVDKILDLSDGRRSIQLSIRRITEAVDANDVDVVGFVRAALKTLKATKPSLHGTIMKSLEACDSSCVAAIARGTEPVVVDGSNVAWHEVTDKPRLQNILDLRNELRSEGYFPVYIYVDAALQYQVDQKSVLQQLIDAGAVITADSHTDADETITEKARALSCAVVTNDRMMDWDPEGEIPKLRFAIDRFGVTIYER